MPAFGKFRQIRRLDRETYVYRLGVAVGVPVGTLVVVSVGVKVIVSVRVTVSVGEGVSVSVAGMGVKGCVGGGVGWAAPGSAQPATRDRRRSV